MARESVGERVIGYAISFVVTSLGAFLGHAIYDATMTALEGRKEKKQEEQKKKKEDKK